MILGIPKDGRIIIAQVERDEATCLDCGKSHPHKWVETRIWMSETPYAPFTECGFDGIFGALFLEALGVEVL